MALSVGQMMHNATNTPSVFFSQLWLRTLESLLDQLLVRTDNQLITVEPTMGLRYQGDLYGLLMAAQIPAKYHWVIMRANGYTSPSQYDGTILTLIQPSEDFVEENMTIFKTMYRKTF